MNKKIAVAGTGYVGLSLAVLLSQKNEVTAVDIIPEKVDKLNRYISPIGDEYIEKYLSEAKAGTRKLNLHATLDGESAYKNADFVNRAGEEAARRSGVHYLYADFKKKNGYLRSLQLSAEYSLYRQNYCGCLYSKEK